MNEIERIGKEIKSRRIGCYLSQRKLAILADIDRKTLNYIERGETHRPRKSTLELIYAVLDHQESIIKAVKDSVDSDVKAYYRRTEK